MIDHWDRGDLFIAKKPRSDTARLVIAYSALDCFGDPRISSGIRSVIASSRAAISKRWSEAHCVQLRTIYNNLRCQDLSIARLVTHRPERRRGRCCIKVVQTLIWAFNRCRFLHRATPRSAEHIQQPSYSIPCRSRLFPVKTEMQYPHHCPRSSTAAE